MALHTFFLPNPADDATITRLRLQFQAHPDDPRRLFELGAALAQRGRFHDAEPCFAQVAQHSPKVASAQYALGRCRMALGDWPGASKALSAAVHLAPNEAGHWLEYGNALLSSERLAEAESAYRRAVALAPGDDRVLANLAGCLSQLGRGEEGLALIDSAIAAKPLEPQLRYNRARLLADLGRDEEAARDLQAALAAQPDFAMAAANLGNALTRCGRFEEALQAFDRALALRPQDGETIYNRAHLLLMRGDFAAGWQAYEARFQRRSVRSRTPPFALWQGEDLRGKSIFIYAEQGLGDTLHFVRYVPLLAGRGARIVLETQPPLKALLAGMAGAAEVLAAGEPVPACDFCLPLLSLPHRFATRLDSVPANIPYLRAEPARIEKWRAWLEARPGLKIGIAWQGNPAYRGDRSRSLPLAQFQPLAEVAGVQLVSLQKGAGSEQAMGWKGAQELMRPGPTLDADGAFLDTAALMASLDLVIAPNTAICHLAGATGRPLWVVLPKVPDWRWLLEREDSPWYPNARLFRQRQAGDWTELFARMAGELAGLAAAKGRAPGPSTQRAP